jgi:hypothetical protein
LSLRTVRRNFSFHRAAFWIGDFITRRHRLWRCQKQPWIKITFRNFGKTISGRPGKSCRWSR